MTRWLAFAPLVVLAALAALFIGWSLKRDPDIKPAALVGRPVPETVLPMLAGDGTGAVLDLKTAGRGRPMLINVFASWCAPCRVEHPKLLALKAQGVTVIGVAYKDRPEDTRAFLTELGDPFAFVLVDAEGRAGLDLGITGAPETFAVNAMGTVTAKHSGALLDDADVARLVAAMQAPAPQARR
ncbi:MAG: DsbE family thiol:disulfide interchange protein [Alphaproteobacteria bacterium]|nr:DsbE family thiol:disulfide interchange protein [Alphaproteobacteria bacterium]MBU1526830.1 DsbE family thiol:disulfide interchange protein [Alphaproteobacteria bacterium]MBU2116874.1 DsbE family thiol:disulfide interchange protein [Alphaproteobacteria bacterium]MBU2351665.1 DsbE family thiol:disulfide interchange protein [Alphaproteobacteria bacterium]MBU2381334.1 DsbE family thiol:disulfide interchange protein [Alphaproteobacteria bacterium]